MEKVRQAISGLVVFIFLPVACGPAEYFWVSLLHSYTWNSSHETRELTKPDLKLEDEFWTIPGRLPQGHTRSLGCSHPLI